MVYSEYKAYGPYTRKDGRQHVCLVHNKTKQKKTVSYPKYIYEIHFNKYIEKGIDVHHIDNDFSNNKISNLELINKKEHSRNHAKKQISKLDLEENYLKCYRCGDQIMLSKKQLRHFIYNRDSRKRLGPFCSKHCIGMFTHNM